MLPAVLLSTGEIVWLISSLYIFWFLSNDNTLAFIALFQINMLYIHLVMDEDLSVLFELLGVLGR